MSNSKVKDTVKRNFTHHIDTVTRGKQTAGEICRKAGENAGVDCHRGSEGRGWGCNRRPPLLHFSVFIKMSGPTIVIQDPALKHKSCPKTTYLIAHTNFIRVEVE
jgi:hypothetical protein